MRTNLILAIRAATAVAFVMFVVYCAWSFHTKPKPIPDGIPVEKPLSGNFEGRSRVPAWSTSTNAPEPLPDAPAPPLLIQSYGARIVTGFEPFLKTNWVKSIDREGFEVGYVRSNATATIKWQDKEHRLELQGEIFQTLPERRIREEGVITIENNSFFRHPTADNWPIGGTAPIYIQGEGR